MQGLYILELKAQAVENLPLHFEELFLAECIFHHETKLRRLQEIHKPKSYTRETDRCPYLLCSHLDVCFIEAGYATDKGPLDETGTPA